MSKGRGKNPVPSIPEKRIRQASQLHADFKGEWPAHIDSYDMRVPSVGVAIGDCDGILYTTKRDGKLEKYIHKFKRNSRPLLAVTHDGKQLILIGGSYQFTERGIEDT